MDFRNLKRVCALNIIATVSLVLTGCGGQGELSALTPEPSMISKTYASVANLGAQPLVVADVLNVKCPSQQVASNFLYMPFESTVAPKDYFGVLPSGCFVDALKSSGLIAAPAVAIGSVSSLYGDYTGFIYDASTGVIDSSLAATISGNSFSVASINLSARHVNFTAVDSPSLGFVQGDVDGADMICMGGPNVFDSGKNALFCLVQNPADASKPLDLILSSR